ncbi:MAG: hypothetical protein CME65_06775 [Halobacteriovoraceae bacterium]|nr:hypothetical protein [Halobacteriovoraceae bacterium]
MQMSDLQIVVIENLKDQWSNTMVRDLFIQLLGIKFEGYGNVYGRHVISADKADYFGTHLIVCEKNTNRPILGYKSVTNSQCEEYSMSFPVTTLVARNAELKCQIELENIISKHRAKEETYSYDYSWAQDPHFMKNRSLEDKIQLQDITMMLGVSHHRDYNIQGMITCGAVKVKTDLFFEKMGLRHVSRTSLFSQAELNDHLSHLFHTEKFSTYAEEQAFKYRELWENRIEFRGENVERKLEKLKTA